MSILIVDDERDVRESLREILASAGYEAVTAASGMEALQRIDRGDISLVLVDLSMPDMSGEDLLRTLMRRKKTPQALVITALPPWQTTGLTTELGIEYLRKPFDCNQLLGTVKTYMAKEEENVHKNPC
jgi:two-component system response regulator YesN